MPKFPGLKQVFLSVLTALFLLATPLLADEALHKEAGEFALEEAVRLLNKMPIERLEKNGYLYSHESPERAALGEPFDVFRLEPEKIHDSDDLKSMITFVAWAFPVVIDGEARTLIMVNKINGKWRLIQFGGYPRDIVEGSIITARKRWSEEAGFKHSFLVITGGPDAIMVEKKEELKLYIFDYRWEETFGLAAGVDGTYQLIEQGKLINWVRIMMESAGN